MTMKSPKSILMVLPVMHGGGAERVAALLVNEFHRRGYFCEFLLTNDAPDTVVKNDLSSDIPLLFLNDFIKHESFAQKILYAFLKLYSSFFCRIFEYFKFPVPAHFAYSSFIAQYHRQISTLRSFLNARPNASVITFLQPSIPMVMLASQELPNKIIFSERGDPRRLMQSRYGRSFVEKYYTRAEVAVFQTKFAMESYPSNIASKGFVIVNPIKENLPKPFVGARKKVINTFCRISKQKNLPLLLEAFKNVHNRYPEYKLHIIGDALNTEGANVMVQLRQFVSDNDLTDAVIFLPFSSNVHKEVLEDAMYVNSSDYEGISNAMLEAMAIGLPVICTDCPIGGARQTIIDHENGLLVPVNDYLALSRAMEEIISSQNLALKLSQNAIAIRNYLQIQNVANQWIKIV